MEGMGQKKLYFPLLKSGKRQKSPLGRSGTGVCNVATTKTDSVSFTLKLTNTNNRRAGASNRIGNVFKVVVKDRGKSKLVFPILLYTLHFEGLPIYCT